MISTVKETIASLRDPAYGKHIIAKTPVQVIWYWSKYLICFSVIFLLFGIFSLTHYLPQLPKALSDFLPEGALTSNNHQLSTTINQPYVLGDSSFSFILNLAGTESDLSTPSAGILLLKDQLLLKTDSTHIQSVKLDKLPNFSVTKVDVIKFVSQNKIKLWIAGCGILLVLSLLGLLLNWSMRLSTFFIYAAVLWILAKFILKKTLVYMDVTKIVFYAGVLPLVLSQVAFTAGGWLFDLLYFGLFVFLALRWIWNLPKS
jgi:hypothetical protein